MVGIWRNDVSYEEYEYHGVEYCPISESYDVIGVASVTLYGRG